MGIPLTLWWRPPKGAFFSSVGKYLAYDSFNRANGALGSTEAVAPNGQPLSSIAWVGSTWTISGSAALNNPTEEAERFTLGTMEVDSGWLNIGTPPINERSNEQAFSGTYSRKVATDTATEAIYNNTITAAPVSGSWITLNGWLYIVTGSARLSASDGYTWPSNYCTPLTTKNAWMHQFHIGYATNGAGRGPSVRNGALDPVSLFYADNLSLRTLTRSTLFATVPVSTPNVLASVEITIPTDTDMVQCGLVLRLDSTSTPLNWIIAYIDRSLAKCYLDKFTLATLNLNLAYANITYVAGGKLAVIANGSNIELYYNNVKKLTAQVTDSAIIGNKIHGLFSNYPGCKLENFTLRAI